MFWLVGSLPAVSPLCNWAHTLGRVDYAWRTILNKSQCCFDPVGQSLFWTMRLVTWSACTPSFLEAQKWSISPLFSGFHPNDIRTLVGSLGTWFIPQWQSPWCPRKPSCIRDRIPASLRCLSTIGLVLVQHVPREHGLSLAGLWAGSFGEPFTLFLEGWCLEEKNLTSITRDTSRVIYHLTGLSLVT